MRRKSAAGREKIISNQGTILDREHRSGVTMGAVMYVGTWGGQGARAPTFQSFGQSTHFRESSLPSLKYLKVQK